MAAFALATTAVTAGRPVATYHAIEVEASAFEIGALGGAFGLLSLVLAIPIGLRIDVAGERPFLIGGAGVAAFGLTMQAISGGLAALMLGQALAGLGFTMVAIASQTRAANGSSIVSPDARFARLAIAVSLGQIAGPAGVALAFEVGDGVDRWSAIQTSYALAIVAAVAAAAAGVFVRSSSVRRSRDAAAFDLREVLARPRMATALAASMVALGALDVLITYLPLLGEQRGFAPSAVALLLALRSTAGLAARIAAPFAVARLGRPIALQSALALAGLGCSVLILNDSAAVAAVAMVALGFGLAAAVPMTIAWVAGLAAAGERGGALAVRMTANRIGQLSAPTVLGAVAAFFGVAAAFAVTAAALFGAARASGRGTRRRRGDDRPGDD